MLRDKPDVHTLTENGNERHRAVMRDVAYKYGYEVVQGAGGQDDCAILLKDKRFRLDDMWTDLLTDLPQNRATGGPLFNSLTALLKDRQGGIPVLYTVTHLTAGVEKVWDNQPLAYRVKVWHAAEKAWGDHTRLLRKQTGAKVVMVSDWNLNLEKLKYRALLKALYPRLTLTWQEFPGPGTHGSRVIDATLTNLNIVGPATLLPDDDSSDHRPYIEVLS